jgi:hypothetical protein
MNPTSKGQGLTEKTSVTFRQLKHGTGCAYHLVEMNAKALKQSLKKKSSNCSSRDLQYFGVIPGLK